MIVKKIIEPKSTVCIYLHALTSNLHQKLYHLITPEDFLKKVHETVIKILL